MFSPLKLFQVELMSNSDSSGDAGGHNPDSPADDKVVNIVP